MKATEITNESVKPSTQEWNGQGLEQINRNLRHHVTSLIENAPADIRGEVRNEVTWALVNLLFAIMETPHPSINLIAFAKKTSKHNRQYWADTWGSDRYRMCLVRSKK